MVKEEGKKQVERKNLKIKSWERPWNWELSWREGKGWEMSQGDVLVGVHRGRVMLQAAARGEWGKFVVSVT